MFSLFSAGAIVTKLQSRAFFIYMDIFLVFPTPNWMENTKKFDGIFWGHFFGEIFGHFWATFGPFWVWNQKWSDHHEILFASISLLSNQEYFTKICFFSFSDHFWAFLGHFGPFLAHFGCEIQNGQITMKFYLQVFHSYPTKNILLKYHFLIFGVFFGHF